MNIVNAPLTNGAYGYPAGTTRRRKPTMLACLHQTANTATAMQERNYANRAHSSGPSATAYIDKDGTIIRALQPKTQAAWSQGIVKSPRMDIPTIHAAVDSGVNMNEWVYESIEVCGKGAEPFSAQQFEAVSQLVAAASKATGIRVSRSTVVVHADIDSVNRPSDPWPAATREARIKRILVRAQAILTPPPAIVNHTVVKGDTLGEIATAHGLTLAKLLAFPQNAAYRKNPALIHVGDVVRVK
jgi:LysM repeat protein